MLLFLFAGLLPPSQHGVIVVRSRVHNLVRLVVVGQVRVPGVAAKRCNNEQLLDSTPAFQKAPLLRSQVLDAR